MEENLFTAGQFAKLARTTKRTITWYSDQGILLPFKINHARYRYYKQRQILDFQVILLLRKLRFSIEEIKTFLAKNNSLKDLFKLKKDIVCQEIKDLQTALGNLDSFYSNLESNGTLVAPQLKEVKAFSIYYIQKEGPYAKIKEYCFELKSYFKKIPQNSVYLTLFLDKSYQPKKAKMKIGIICEESMSLREEAKDIVKKECIFSYRALSHVHKGSGAVLSMLWQELGDYAGKKGYKANGNLPFYYLEFYIKTSLNGFTDEENMIFEINYPVL
ncbi:MAG: MerR family transcriptional regulator [Candidatus Levybacteria bacterium]|nr:MerR family transcriptional regulator [Candidatus Levybacteria bacterium]